MRPSPSRSRRPGRSAVRRDDDTDLDHHDTPACNISHADGSCRNRGTVAHRRANASWLQPRYCHAELGNLYRAVCRQRA